MADDSDNVQISFTAQIESLQEGIQMGEDLIKEFSDEIATLQTRLNSLSEVGGDWAAYQAMKAMQTEMDSVSAKTDILKGKLATLSVPQFQVGSLQYAIDDSLRLNESMSSARASAAVFQASLGNVGISATEMGIQEREAAAATDALNRSTGSFYQSQAAGRAAVSANLSALQGQNVAYQTAAGAASTYGASASNAGRITAQTSMFAKVAGESLGTMSIRTAGLSREMIVLAHEMASNRFSRIPGSLMVMAEMFTGLTPAIAGVTLALFATAGAIGYFTYRAIELSNTVRDINIGAQFAGNMDITNQAIESTIKELEKMHGMSRDTAEEMVSSFARMRGMTTPDLQAMSTLAAEFAQQTGTTAKEATQKLTSALENENLRIGELAKMFPGATAAQLENTQAVIQSGNAHEREASLMILEQDQLDRTKDATIRKDAAMTSSMRNFVTYVGLLEAGIPYEKIESELIEDQTKKWNAHAAAVRADAEALKNRPLTGDELKLQNDIDMASIDTAGTQIKKLTKSIADFNAELKTTPAGSDRFKELTKDIKLAQGSIDELNHKQSKQMDFGTNLAGQEEIRQVKETNAEISADTKLSAEQQHDIIAANWRRLLDEGKLTADQRKEVETEMWNATGAAARAGSAQTIAQARNSIAQINADEKKGAAEKLADIVAVWAEVKDSDKLGYQQRLQAQTEYYKAESAAAKQAHAVAVEDAKSDAQTAIQISHLKLQEERTTLTEGFKLHQTSAADRTKLLQDLADREEQIDEQELRDEMAIIGKGNAGYEEAYNKILVLREQLKAEKARIAAEELEEDRANARQSVTNWRSAVNEIMAAEDQMITGIIGGRETMKQILGKMIDSFVTKELEADARYLTQHLLLSEAELSADKAADQAGLLYKVMFETQKTAVTASGEAARTTATVAGTATREGVQAAAATTENASFLVRAARWVASELGMTSATTVGTAARASAQAGESAAQAAALAQNAIEAESFAALSAVEAAASVAAIPVIGWTMAPEVAAAQYASMQPFVAAASLAVGAWSIPHDMPAHLHEGETVVPKTFAEGLRSSGSLAGTTVTAKGGNTTHLTYAPTINAPQQKSLPEMLATHASAMHKFVNSAIRDGSIRT